MNPLRWLVSPVAGTAGVLAAIGLLAIPLRHLTSAEENPVLPDATAASAKANKTIHAVLRLRLLAAAKHVTVTTADGVVLLDSRDMAAGESECDVVVPWADRGLDLTLRADFGTGAAATAVFLTVMPDGYDDQTRYAIGAGPIEEGLRYEWHKP